MTSKQISDINMLDKLEKTWYKACFEGNIEVATTLSNQMKFDWNKGLFIACMYDHKNIASLMICKGATNLNSVLNDACYYGYLDIINLLLEKGAATNLSKLINNYNIPKFAISRHTTFLDWALMHACYGGQPKAALLMIEKGATEVTSALVVSCYKRREDIALLMIEKGADINKCCTLTENDIDYLLGKIKNFGKYKDVAILIQQRRELANSIIKELNMLDVNTIICTY